MDFEEFTLRYELTRRQRLIPHLRLWAPYSVGALIMVSVAIALAVWDVVSIPPVPRWLLWLSFFLFVLLPFVFFFKGFLGALLNVLLVRTHPMDLIIKKDTLGVSVLGQRFWFSLDGTLSFRRYTDDTWTLYHQSGQIVTIPTSELTEDQVKHFQEWAAAQGSHSIRAPQLKSFAGRVRIECYTSKLKLLGLIGAAFFVIGACYFFTTASSLAARVFGWFGVGVGSVVLVLAPRQLLRTGPQVVINDEGIEDRRKKLGVIRWEDIRSIAIWTQGEGKFLGIEVADPDKYLPRQPRWLQGLSEPLGHPALRIDFTALSPGLMEVWAQLEALDTADDDLRQLSGIRDA